MTYYESRKTIGAYDVKPGLRMPFHVNTSDVGFSVVVRCHQSHPTELWSAEVRFGPAVVMETEQTFERHDLAGRAAIAQLAQRMGEVLTEQ